MENLNITAQQIASRWHSGVMVAFLVLAAGSVIAADFPVFLSDDPLRDFVDSDLSDPEFQTTFGVKWATSVGVFGVGLTENVFLYANTPDIGIHLSWGNFFGSDRNKR